MSWKEDGKTENVVFKVVALIPISPVERQKDIKWFHVVSQVLFVAECATASKEDCK